MKSRSRMLVLAAVVSAASMSVCFAADADAGSVDASSPGSMTLDSSIDAALLYSEANGMFDSEVAAFRSERRETRAGSRPQLNVTPELRQYFSGDSGSEFNLSGDLGQRFLEIPQNMVRNRIAAGRVEVAEERGRRLRIQYATRVMRVYIACLRAGQDVDRGRGLLGMAEKEQAAWDRVTTVDRGVDERRARAGREAERLRTSVADAEAMRGECERQLRQLCGLGDVDVTLADPPPYAMPPITLDACLQWAMNHRSDLAALQREKELLAQGVRLARMDRLPRPRATFGYDSGGSGSDLDSDREGVFAMFALEIPLWDAGLAQARAAQLAARRDAAEIRIPELESEISAAVSESYVRLRQAAGALGAKVNDPAAAKAFREADVRFGLGGMSPHEYEAARLLWDAQRAEVQAASWACYEAEAHLLEAVQATRADLAAGLPAAEAQEIP